ncbi:MAG: ABC transporter substrate-binding protein [Chloroflexi bacterium]|nr:ABC transporter substrate-binding protein [Chloroflexota bacterium]
MKGSRVGVVLSPLSRRDFLKSALALGGTLALSSGALAGLTGCAPAAPKSLTKAPARLGWTKCTEYAGMFVADDKGYYKDEGLEVDIRTGGAGIDPIALVAAGSEDVGVPSSGAMVITSRSRGIPVKAFGAQYEKLPFCLLSLKESGIKSVKDLKGKVVAWTPEARYMLEMLLKMHGMSPTDVKIVGQGYDVTPLIMKQWDACSAWIVNQPYLVQKAGKEWSCILGYDLGIRFHAMIYAASDELIAKEPGKIEGFLRATLRGWKYALEHQQEAIDLVVNKYAKGADPAVERFQMDTQIPLILTETTRKHGMAWMSGEVWDFGMKMLYEYKQITKLFNIDEVFTMDFLQKVHKPTPILPTGV